MENRPNGFTAYDYKEVAVEADRASMILDGYENFGWMSDENFPEMVISSQKSRMLVRMKRDRKIINKAELTRLQRNFESCIEQIRELEYSKKSVPAAVALAAGVVGTAFIAGSVFAVTAQQPYIILSIILAVPGFTGWILPYFIYRGMLKKQEEKVAPFIEAKLDEIYEICEKGNRLLN